jgi:acyl-CoA-binding protein
VGDSDDANAPWMVQWEASLKFNAWTANRGMSKDDAMKAYIVELQRQIEVYAPAL